MRQIWSIATKELRGYFNSAVAIIFLATFLSVVMFTFFWVDDFFVRNLADVTPLFHWLPILLIFLVAALTMRLWSEEQKTGTLEILLTLPVPVHRLVMGKFLAGLLLVAVALGLTLGLPITVSMMGNLDWGPVIGGYVGALLLASAYLAIGLCISSTTENQIVALIATVAVCAAFYLPGTEAVASLFGVEGGHVLRLIGTGSRFESVARGVLDIRDLAYYAALVFLFLTLNTVLLEAKRWSKSERTRPGRTNATTAVALVALNALALNLWIQPVTAARVDLTEDDMYSLSAPTEKLLASLEEPLVLRGYFSDKTHPLLVPLVPQIRNMLSEYEIAGGSNVQLDIVDPSQDEELEAEAFERYEIRPTPFQFAGRHEQSIVNAYFHILVAYGDQHVVLGVGDLINVSSVDVDNFEAYVDNLEYEVTKSIRKVVYGFQSVDALFASLPGTMELDAYVTPESLPEQWQGLPAQLDAVAEALESQSAGKLTYRRVAPTTEAEQMELYEQYGMRPFSTSTFSNDSFYMHLLLKMGDRVESVALPEKPTEATLNKAIRAAVERLAPGFTKVVGVVTPPPKIENPPMPGMQAPPPQQVQSFRTLADALRDGYEVRGINIDGGTVPDDVDVLLLAGPENVAPEAQKAIDQFLMRGGAVIVLAGQYRLDMDAFRNRAVTLQKVDAHLKDLLAAYGVEVSEQMVLDDENAPFPMPRTRNLGGSQVQVVEPLDYPFFVRVGDAGMGGGMVTGGLGAVIMHWASPVKLIEAPAGEAGEPPPVRRVEKLLMSSKDAWLQADASSASAQTDFGRPQGGAGEDAPYLLAVAIAGQFDSALSKEDAAKLGAGAVPERLIERSTRDARLVVVGSSSFVSDAALAVSNSASTREVVNNLKLMQNLVDWAAEDTEMLSIRSRGNTVRTMSGVAADARGTWELANYLIALLGLGLVVVVARLRRQASIAAASRIIKPQARKSAQQKNESNGKESA